MPNRAALGRERAVTSSPLDAGCGRGPGVSKPAISRSAVVLPLPDGPRSATISPFADLELEVAQDGRGAEALAELIEDE